MACLVYIAAAGRRLTAFSVLAVALASAAAAGLPDFRSAGAMAASGFTYLTVWTVGYAKGMHRRYTAHLLRNQSQLARAELQQARRDVTEERMRIARELHDVVAHSMSVITVQAAFGALVVGDESPDARAALTAIESTGRQTLTELRALVGVLRTAESGETIGSSDLAPAPSLADLGSLIEQTARAGVAVDLTVSGPQRPLPAGIELSAYRIVQESLTNVVRHAATTTAQARIAYSATGLTIEVTDDGRHSATTEPAGHGLIGMRERVRLYGGSMQAGPGSGGGFRVLVTLPSERQDSVTPRRVA
jgi:signal transduction histidine kinase